MKFWPDSLPKTVLFDGYGETPLMPRVSFPPDVGFSIDRPRGTFRSSSIKCTAMMSGDQVEMFRNFVFDDLGQGTMLFMIEHPRRQRQVIAKMIGDPLYSIDPFGPEDWLVSFTIQAAD